MPDYVLKFTDPNAGFEFIDLALRNAVRLGLDRQNLDELYFETVPVPGRAGEDETHLTIVLQGAAEAAWDELRRLGRLPPPEQTAQPRGEKRTIDAMLERVKLARHSGAPPGGSEDRAAAVLLFDARDDDYRTRFNDLLSMGCRRIEVAFIDPTPENGSLSHVLMIGSVPNSFQPPDSWASPQRGRSAALTFYRFRPAEDCIFYVQWNYLYPIERVERLHKFQVEMDRAVFACAALPDDDPATAKPRWLRLPVAAEGGRLLHGPDQQLRLELAAGADIQALRPGSMGTPAAFGFEVVRHARGGMPLSAIEGQMTSLQQSLDQFQRDYSAAHALRNEPLYLALVFEQELDGADGSPPKLSSVLARFLDQPYSHLQRYKYGFFEDEGGPVRRGRHVFVGDQPTAYAQVLTQLASEIYVQTAGWHESNLPLFVRYGDELRPRLDDSAFNEPIQRLLWEPQGHPTHEPVLLRALSPEEQKAGGQPWQALCIRGLVSLTDPTCFQFLNDRFASSLLEFRAQVPYDLEAQLQSVQSQVTERTAQIELAIERAVHERIDHAEAEWMQIDARVETAGKTASEHNASVQEIQRCIAAFPGKWKGFITEVFRSNSHLIDPQITALNAYRGAQENFVLKVKEYQDGLIDVRAQVDANRKEVETRRTNEVKLRNDANTSIEQLQGELTTSYTHNKTVTEHVDKLLVGAQRKLAKATADLNQTKDRVHHLQGQIQAIQDQLRALKVETENQTRLENNLAARTVDLEGRQRQLENDRHRLAQSGAAYEAKKQVYQKALADHQRERTALEQKNQALQQAVEKERAAHDQELVRLRGVAAAIELERSDAAAARRRVASLVTFAENSLPASKGQQLPKEFWLRLNAALAQLNGP